MQDSGFHCRKEETWLWEEKVTNVQQAAVCSVPVSVCTSRIDSIPAWPTCIAARYSWQSLSCIFTCSGVQFKLLLARGLFVTCPVGPKDYLLSRAVDQRTICCHVQWTRGLSVTFQWAQLRTIHLWIVL